MLLLVLLLVLVPVLLLLLLVLVLVVVDDIFPTMTGMTTTGVWLQTGLLSL